MLKWALSAPPWSLATRATARTWAPWGEPSSGLEGPHPGVPRAPHQESRAEPGGSHPAPAPTASPSSEQSCGDPLCVLCAPLASLLHAFTPGGQKGTPPHLPAQPRLDSRERVERRCSGCSQASAGPQWQSPGGYGASSKAVGVLRASPSLRQSAGKSPPPLAPKSVSHILFLPSLPRRSHFRKWADLATHTHTLTDRDPHPPSTQRNWAFVRFVWLFPPMPVGAGKLRPSPKEWEEVLRSPLPRRALFGNQ